jgi:uncharacterized protein with FMN-binding domain
VVKSSSSRRIANNLVALSSAAVLTVYAAGYMKTRAAAERLENAGHRDPADRPALRAPAPEAVVGPIAKDVVQPPQAPPAPIVEVNPAPAAIPQPKAAAPVQPETTVVPAPLEAPTTPQVVAPPIVEPAEPKKEEPPAPKPSPYRDGTYYGWGTSRHGSIQAAVVIDGGRIVSATIAQCLTRYSCSWIAHLPPQVVLRQSADVDYVSGATQSTYAFYDAVVEALSKAR